MLTVKCRQMHTKPNVVKHKNTMATQKPEEKLCQSGTVQRWTDKEFDLFVITQQYKVIKMQENAISSLSSTTWWENRRTFIWTDGKSPPS